MVTFTDDIAAIRALQNRLATQFATGDYAASYSGYGGVDVVFIYDESDVPEHIGKPMILIEGTGEKSPFSSVNQIFRTITATATIRVSDFDGGQVGTANPVSSDEQLSIDLVKEIESNWQTWQGLGLLMIEIRSGNLRTSADQDKTPIRETPHVITFHYYRA